MNARSLKFQLIGWYAVVLTGCFGLIAIATYLALQNSLVGALKENQLRRARQIGELVREEVVRAQESSSGSTAVVLSEPPPLVEGVRPAASLQGQATESEGSTVLIDHDDLASLNSTLDRLRAAGAQIVEVRRVRQDLEASFEAAVTGAPRAPLASPERPPEPPETRTARVRPLVAAARVAADIATDLAQRKVGWFALALAVLVLGAFLWVLRSESLSGAAVAVKRFGGPAGLSDPATLAHWAGRWIAGTAYWAMLLPTLLVSALFAPPLLDPRRTILLLAQPVGRGDVALGIFAAVCGMAFVCWEFLAVLLFLGLRVLDFAVSPMFLLMPLPLLAAFAALYAGVLLATYAVRSGPFAVVVALFSFLAVVSAGNSDVAREGAAVGFGSLAVGLLPRAVQLGQQAMRLGGGERASALPFVFTTMYCAAVLIALFVVARRSEK